MFKKLTDQAPVAKINGVLGKPDVVILTDPKDIEVVSCSRETAVSVHKA